MCFSIRETNPTGVVPVRGVWCQEIVDPPIRIRVRVRREYRFEYRYITSISLSLSQERIQMLTSVRVSGTQKHVAILMNRALNDDRSESCPHVRPFCDIHHSTAISNDNFNH